jgi:hypothetical protein
MYPLLQLIYCAWLIGLAYINKRWIDEHYKIRHFWNGAAHVCFIIMCFLNFGWAIALAAPFFIRPVFDAALSLFRGFSIGYVSASPKSLIDRIEKKIFRNNGILPKILFISIAIALNILHFLAII